MTKCPRSLDFRTGDLFASSEVGHGEIGADPGAEGGEEDVDPVFGVADDGEGGEEIPDAAPGSGGDAAAGGDGGVEEDVDGVGGCGGDEYAESEQEIEMRHGRGPLDGLGSILVSGCKGFI